MKEETFIKYSALDSLPEFPIYSLNLTEPTWKAFGYKCIYILSRESGELFVYLIVDLPVICLIESCRTIYIS